MGSRADQPGDACLFAYRPPPVAHCKSGFCKHPFVFCVFMSFVHKQGILENKRSRYALNQNNKHTVEEPVEDGSLPPEAETPDEVGEAPVEEMPAEEEHTPEAPSAAAVEELQQRLAAAEDRFLRKEAEFRNYRRRTEEEKVILTGLGRRLVIQRFLDVLDDFGRSLEAAEQVEAQQEEKPGLVYYALKEGFELVYRKIMGELAKEQVEPIEAVGEPFDEQLHEAVMQQEVEGTAPGIVVGEVQKGYRMGDHILRHSKVIVSA